MTRRTPLSSPSIEERHKKVNLSSTNFEPKARLGARIGADENYFAVVIYEMKDFEEGVHPFLSPLGD